MTKKEQPVDVIVLEKIQRIKNLERDLRGDILFPVLDSDSLRALESRGVTKQETEEFVRDYSDFVENYISGMICGRLNAVYKDNEVKDRPEGRYIQDLMRVVGKSKPRVVVEAVYDIRLDSLKLSVRSADRLKDDKIKYIGQLVQKSEAEMLRIPNFGRKSLSELKEILEPYGLHFGMELEYLSPEVRE